MFSRLSAVPRVYFFLWPCRRAFGFRMDLWNRLAPPWVRRLAEPEEPAGGPQPGLALARYRR